MSRRALLAGLVGLPVIGGIGALLSGRNPYYSGPVSGHFDGSRFVDPHGTPPKSIAQLVRWLAGSDPQAEWPDRVANLPAEKPVARVMGSDLRVTLIGHASILLQTQGLNLLVDPVYAERASPLSFAGPKRVNRPGIAFEDLPAIDAVLVTHNHYDHLDLATLRRLWQMFGMRVITPLGNDTIIRQADPAIRVEAYDWGDRVVLGEGVAVHLHPSRHWSARGLFDRNCALWAAFVFETPGGLIYHIGDTGYGDGHHVRAARQRFGEFRLAILPIGAYEPRWFMRDQHVNPQEAVQIFSECGARHALAHHWGTFQLTNEGRDAPRLALTEALRDAGVAEDRFRALEAGLFWDIPA